MNLSRGLAVTSFLSLVGVALVGSGCDRLDVIEPGCGNRVFEPELGEDCDGHNIDDGRCGNVDDEGNLDPDGVCKFVCDTQACPAQQGYQCGSDGICRRPSGAFELAPDTIPVAATRLLSKSLGKGVDRSDELLVFDGANLGIYRFDDRGRIIDLQTIAARGSEIAIGEFTRSNEPAVALRYEASSSAVGVALFTISPEGTLSAIDTLSPDLAREIKSNSTLLTTQGFDPALHEILFTLDDRGLRAVYPDNPSIAPPTTIFGNQNLDKANLAGLAVADVFGLIPCDETAVAVTPENEVRLVRVCTSIGVLNENAGGLKIDVPAAREFVPTEDVVRRPSVFFLKSPAPPADELVDVLVYTQPAGCQDECDRSLYLARQTPPDPLNNVPAGVETEFSPLDVPSRQCNGEDESLGQRGRPLAFADLNGDDVVDAVTEDAVFLSTEGKYLPTLCNETRWHTATVVDFTGNKLPDLLVQEQESLPSDTDPDAREQNGTALLALINNGDGAFTQFRITSAPVRDYATGDFDGDGVDDVAFVFDRESSTSGDEVFVSYGQATGGPTQAIRVADFDDQVAKVAAGRLVGDDAATELVVVTEPSEDTFEAYVLIGSGTRQLIAPLLFEDSENPRDLHTPLRLVSTRFPLQGDSAAPDVLTTLTSFGFGGGNTNATMWFTDLQNPALPESRVDEYTHEIFFDEPVLTVALDLDPTGDPAADIDEVIALRPEYAQFFVNGYLYSGTRDGLSALPEHLREPPPPVVVDIDDDGLEDALFISSVDPDAARIQLTLLRNTGQGVDPDDWSKAAASVEILSTLVPMVGSSTDIELDDEPRVPQVLLLKLDGDDREDVVVVADKLYIARLVDGALTLEAAAQSQFTFPETAAAGDFNGDGVDDIAIGDEEQIRIYLGIDRADESGNETVDILGDLDAPTAPTEPGN